MKLEKSANRKAVTVREKPRRLLPVAQQESVIISIAADLFLQRGYGGVSIDAITSIAGGSKRDIYLLFGDKESLFERCITMLVEENTAPLKRISPVDDIRTCLKSAGLLIVDIFLQPKTLALHKLIVANADLKLSASKSFLEGGPQRVYQAVADLLVHHDRCNLTNVSDAKAFAKIFVGGLTAELQIRALMGETIDISEREAKVDLAVRSFLEGVCAQNP
ncbi:TetR/AcrR family transcriptional regulator [Neorhizobium sp. JUb45]|uniref:TetR/AcrR family transcriptional regulator n=1 Tax=Neorhizobium sp. JUb45 TaxID=2485113 RepID=UPI0010E605B2|nr:TetR/AcrR family transcriptional regulator [Neorhizobium sp. JUb45]TCQ99432.1 TetR family transcriptional regulator [Neorhizobium sp. JUb45]